MRRPTVIAAALVALAGGVAAGCGGDDGASEAASAATTTAAASSTTAGGPAGGAAAGAAVRDLKADLAAVVADMRARPFGRGEARLAALDERLAAISAGIAALEADAGAPGAPDASVIANLREAEGHLRRYIAQGRAGEEIAMQLSVYRYLWALNRLPASLSDLYGA
ncbi:hypothetical protein [Miltoncostaea marina]|uniref:hypothetical protein n=1 Tax=Miltoncostaea marina TaxID=2843215 RepID=UPI001C3E7059|nr:hypothetical protein [Miltoncostaea marina]